MLSEVDVKPNKPLSRADKAEKKINELQLRRNEADRGQAITLRAYQDLLNALRKLSSESPAAYENLRKHEAIYDIRALYPVVDSFTTLPSAFKDLSGDTKQKTVSGKAKGKGDGKGVP
ncbi:hypothetical protein CIC12_12895 [Burkholderia sp. SG-MS1]|nr:hypothetical protein [Paraburkholderia sp. SG-MS1]